MRIHSIELVNVRGISHLSLTDLPETGVIVIAGDNEQGKSTILEAVNLVLTTKAGSGKQSVKAIQPKGSDVASIISLSATVGPVTFTVTKTYNRKKSTELTVTVPTYQQFSGDAAEAELTRILDEHLDAALLETLFMEQGAVEASVSAVGIPSVTQALGDSATDGDDAAAEDTALMKAVEREYQRFFSAKQQKPAKEYLQAITARDDARAAQESAASEVATLREYVDRVERITASRDAAEAALPGAISEYQERTTLLNAARSAREKVESITVERDRAAQDLKRAQQSVDQRAGLCARVEDAHAAMAALSDGLDEVRSAAEKEKDTVAALTKRLAEARIARDDADARVKSAQAIHTGLVNHARCKELETLIASLDESDSVISALTKRMPQRAVTDADVDRVEEAAAELRVQKAVAAARTGFISLTADDVQSITVNGADTEVGKQDHTIELTQEVNLRIGGVTVTVKPGDGVVGSRRELESADVQLHNLLSELGAENVSDVRALRDRHAHIASELADATQRRSMLLHGEDPERLRAEREQLLATLEGIDLPEDVSIDDAAEEVKAANAALDTAMADVSRTDAELEPWREQTARQELTKRTIQIDAAGEECARALADLEKAREDASDDDLDAAVDEATRAVEKITTQLVSAEAALAESDPDLAESLAAGARSNMEQHRKTIQDSDVTLASLTSRIEQAAGAQERLIKAEAEVESAERRLESVERRARAVQRLREVLTRHRDESRARYAGPFSDRITALASRIFGAGVSFNLDEELRITGRQLDGRVVSLEELSGGAREQLAILTRFVIAELAAGSGATAPVFIDDALGSTDIKRLALMSTLFSDAGRTGQVFVLTCVPERYGHVPNKEMRMIEDLKDGVLVS